MVANPLASAMAKDEAAQSADMTKQMNKALADKSLAQKVEKATTKSANKPQKEVLALFEKAIKAESGKLAKANPNMAINVTPTYAMKGKTWVATAKVAANYNMRKAGGGTHVVAPGDTLWDLAQRHYGYGAWWDVIAKANKGLVSKDGKLILCGATIVIPKMDVVADVSNPPQILKAAKPSGAAKAKAIKIAFPVLEYDLEKVKAVHVKVIVSTAGTLIIVSSFKGSIKATRKGTIPVGFNLRTMEAEIKASGKYFENSIKISKLGIAEMAISSNAANATWKGTFSITSKGSFKLSLAPKPIAFKHKDIGYEGNVGFEVEATFIPKIPVPKTKPFSRHVLEWLKENGARAVGVAIMTGATALVVGTIVEDFATGGWGIADDAISFAAARAAFGRGLQMVKVGAF
ncbi:MAG: LysM peptidoglycan-binding domain-containing protein [Pseudomonadota bacterium]